MHIYSHKNLIIKFYEWENIHFNSPSLFLNIKNGERQEINFLIIITEVFKHSTIKLLLLKLNDKIHAQYNWVRKVRIKTIGFSYFGFALALMCFNYKGISSKQCWLNRLSADFGVLWFCCHLAMIQNITPYVSKWTM